MLSKQQPTQQPTLHLTARGYKYWAENKHRREDNGVKTIHQLSGAKQPPPRIVQAQIKHIKNNITTLWAGLSDSFLL